MVREVTSVIGPSNSPCSSVTSSQFSLVIDAPGPQLFEVSYRGPKLV